MTAPLVSIRLPDLPRFVLKLGQTRRAVRDLQPGFKAAVPEIRTAVTRWFESEGRGTWAPLAQSTVEARENRWGYYRTGMREGGSHRILHARHRLRRSMTSSGGDNISFPLSRTEWQYGSRDPRAAFHHFGEDPGVSRNPVPARPLVPRDELPKLVGARLVAHVLDPWRRNLPNA